VASRLEFRNDVQGLRGLAVGLVVLEHATDVVPGGFIGVDVFFVISGFVITQTLLRELQESGSISVREFFSRRARRLIPALAIVIPITLVITALVLSPGLEHEKAAGAALAASVFAANVWYLLQGGYFFLEFDPFRHLWSLGVEEQFYLFYPLLLIVLVSAARKARLNRTLVISIALMGLSLVSIVSSEILAQGKSLPLATRLSFFGTPFRLWELLAGALVALLVPSRIPRLTPIVHASAILVGFALIGWAAATYGPFTLFPGLSALPPVLGSVIIIVAGSTQSVRWNPLQLRPMTYLGDISYGLYLWHWPLVVFSKRLYPTTELVPVLAVVVAIVVSHVQLRIIETPIRNRSDIVGVRALRLFSSGVVVIASVAAGLVLISRSGLGLEEESPFERLPFAAEACLLSAIESVPQGPCRVERTGATRLMLIGDSQAAAFSDGFVALAEKLGASYLMVYENSCPVHARENTLRPPCRDSQSRWKDLAIEYQPNVVVVANASDLYVSRGGFGKPDAQIAKADGGEVKNYREALANWVTGVRDVLSQDWISKTPVVYVQMPPVPPSQQASLLRQSVADEVFPLSRSFDRNTVVAEERKILASLANVSLVDPADVLCSNEQCKLSINGLRIYADAYHVNSRGALLLADSVGAKTLELLDR
jgi:peptidoglycan/LPS O-acetylase OafA/YrhL